MQTVNNKGIYFIFFCGDGNSSERKQKELKPPSCSKQVVACPWLSPLPVFSELFVTICTQGKLAYVFSPYFVRSARSNGHMIKSLKEKKPQKIAETEDDPLNAVDCVRPPLAPSSFPLSPFLSPFHDYIKGYNHGSLQLYWNFTLPLTSFLSQVLVTGALFPVQPISHDVFLSATRDVYLTYRQIILSQVVTDYKMCSPEKSRMQWHRCRWKLLVLTEITGVPQLKKRGQEGRQLCCCDLVTCLVRNLVTQLYWAESPHLFWTWKVSWVVLFSHCMDSN